ncbi:hypothetical protein D3C71_1316740 [compost metagenome]
MFTAQCLQRRVYAGQQTLRSRFLVTGGAIDLAGEEQAVDRLGLKRALQSTWIKVVVLDGIPGAHDVRILQTRQGVDQIQLHVEWQTGRHAIGIDLVRVQPFGLQEDLVRCLVGETMDLVFDGRAIARAHAFNDAAVHR